MPALLQQCTTSFENKKFALELYFETFICDVLRDLNIAKVSKTGHSQKLIQTKYKNIIKGIEKYTARNNKCNIAWRH